MKPKRHRRVLAIDVGGSHVKMRVFGRRELRQFEPGPKLNPRQMAARVHELTGDWTYDAVSIGYPGIVLHGKIAAEPHNLGSGWVGFNFHRAFGRPTHVINDAAMQAVGSYEGGRMLFLGLGTGLGSAMIVDGVVAPMELAHLRYKKERTYEQWVGEHSLKRLGIKKWSRTVSEVVAELSTALEPDYVVIGGGNARKLKRLAEKARAWRTRFLLPRGFSF